MQTVVPKMLPQLVKDVQLLEGDGGTGTIFLFNFSHGKSFHYIQTLRYQKEKIVELDETVNRFGLEVVEGGHLDHGFSMYKTTFQLTDAAADDLQGNKYQTIVDVTVAYEFDIEVEECDMPSMTMAYTLNFVKSLEKYLLCDVAGDLVIG
ncbi:Phytohormone-binding protein CSBP [Linum perenne]